MPAQVIPATMSSTEDKSLLATAAPPPRRLKSIAAAAALLGLSFGLGAVVASSVKGKGTTALWWQQYVTPAPAAPPSCGPINAQLKAMPPKGFGANADFEAAKDYVLDTLMPVCGWPSSGVPAQSAPVNHCPICTIKLAQALTMNDECAV